MDMIIIKLQQGVLYIQNFSYSSPKGFRTFEMKWCSRKNYTGINYKNHIIVNSES